MVYKDGSKVSLQLLTMPDFLKQLNTKNKRNDERSSYLGSEERYRNPKVLVGFWNDRSSSSSRRKDVYRKTFYETDFKPPRTSAKEFRDLRDKLQDYKSRLNGFPYYMTMYHGEYSQYDSNFTSLYDLTYGRACPSLLHPPHKKFNIFKNEMSPQVDYCENYGNLTHRGLKEYLESTTETESHAELARLRTREATVTASSYVPHKTPVYKELRSTPKAISSSANQTLSHLKDLAPRGERIRYLLEAPDYKFPVIANREPHGILPFLDPVFKEE